MSVCRKTVVVIYFILSYLYYYNLNLYKSLLSRNFLFDLTESNSSRDHEKVWISYIEDNSMPQNISFDDFIQNESTGKSNKNISTAKKNDLMLFNSDGSPVPKKNQLFDILEEQESLLEADKNMQTEGGVYLLLKNQNKPLRPIKSENIELKTFKPDKFVFDSSSEESDIELFKINVTADVHSSPTLSKSYLNKFDENNISDDGQNDGAASIEYQNEKKRRSNRRLLHVAYPTVTNDLNHNPQITEFFYRLNILLSIVGCSILAWGVILMTSDRIGFLFIFWLSSIVCLLVIELQPFFKTKIIRIIIILLLSSVISSMSQLMIIYNLYFMPGKHFSLIFMKFIIHHVLGGRLKPVILDDLLKRPITYKLDHIIVLYNLPANLVVIFLVSLIWLIIHFSSMNNEIYNFNTIKNTEIEELQYQKVKEKVEFEIENKSLSTLEYPAGVTLYDNNNFVYEVLYFVGMQVLGKLCYKIIRIEEKVGYSIINERNLLLSDFVVYIFYNLMYYYISNRSIRVITNIMSIYASTLMIIIATIAGKYAPNLQNNIPYVFNSKFHKFASICSSKHLLGITRCLDVVINLTFYDFMVNVSHNGSFWLYYFYSANILIKSLTVFVRFDEYFYFSNNLLMRYNAYYYSVILLIGILITILEFRSEMKSLKNIIK